MGLCGGHIFAATFGENLPFMTSAARMKARKCGDGGAENQLRGFLPIARTFFFFSSFQATIVRELHASVCLTETVFAQ